MRYLLFVAALLAVTASAQDNFNPLKNEGAAATVAATRIRDITPNDGCTVIEEPNRAVWIGGAGNLKVKTYGGDVVTITGVQAGSLLPLVIQCVYSTGTTATSIQVWW